MGGGGAAVRGTVDRLSGRMGRYVPQFAFLSILLGDEPVLSVQDRFYQRLLARDQEEAADLAESSWPSTAWTPPTKPCLSGARYGGTRSP